jgi:hypothetical protein
MSDLYRVRDIWPLEHFDRNAVFPSGGGGMDDVRTQLNKE